MRFSKEGYWGNGIYFAVNSSYSNAYAFRAPQNERQMFCAEVIIGETIHLIPDESLKMPPLKEGKKDRYDSVNGETGGSNVYIVYANKKVYPKYLITYLE